MNISRNVEKINATIRYLESVGFNTKDLYEQFGGLLCAEEATAPHVDDLAYELPLEHRTWDARIAEGCPLLSCSVAYEGWQYELTPGQRDWIREHYNMTPARTVTLTQLGHWKGTRHPKEFLLTSGEHVNPVLRRNCLVMARITTPGTFFRESLALDKAREESKGEPRAEGTPRAKSSSTTIKDLDAMMADLEKELG